MASSAAFLRAFKFYTLAAEHYYTELFNRAMRAKIVSTVFIYLPCKLLLNVGYLDRCQPRLIFLIRDVSRLECHFVPNVILEAKLLHSTQKELVKRPS